MLDIVGLGSDSEFAGVSRNLQGPGKHDILEGAVVPWLRRTADTRLSKRVAFGVKRRKRRVGCGLNRGQARYFIRCVARLRIGIGLDMIGVT